MASMENIDKDTILNHFPNIYQRCLEEGYDVTKECIPVVPAQHYFIGSVSGWIRDSKDQHGPALCSGRNQLQRCTWREQTGK